MPPKEVFAPHVGRNVKLGRTRPDKRGMRLHFRDYLRRASLKLPAIPPTYDYSPLAMPALSQMYCNDQLGCCVVSAGYHVAGVETGNAGSIFLASDAQIIADYGSIGGYNPADPSTDQGCDERTAFSFWTSNGFADGTKLAGYAVVDGTDVNEVMAATYLFGGSLFFGMELPDAWVASMPNASGFTWDVAGAPDPNNGHAVMGMAYNASGVTISTWGMTGLLTYAAVAAYTTASAGGELYVLLTPDQLAKGASMAPNGVAWADLQADLTAISGGGGNPPAPPPAPPAPSPGAVTLGLADVQALLAQGWPSS
jgi:hypothetical protein